MRFKSIVSVVLLFSALGLISCQFSSEDKKDPIKKVNETDIRTVTSDTFINGKKFCDLYVNNGKEISKEYGKWIQVPKDYDHPGEMINIYAYTRKPFDPSLPSFIFVDGGPGQNTHQSEDLIGEVTKEDKFKKEEFNQINFDQRGVGCSTPDTWDEYKNQKLYSSQNTVYDMEEIRKSFGIEKWAVYGISYGTIPSTMYASEFASHTKSLVLEGVVGGVEFLSRFDYLAEKLNLAISSFNSEQKSSFNEVMATSRKKNVIVRLMMTAKYMDAGFRRLRDNLLLKLFPEKGGFDEEFYQKIVDSLEQEDQQYSTPQHPGVVDENILNTLYCKELEFAKGEKYTLMYSSSYGFYEGKYEDEKAWEESCSQYGVTKMDQNLYEVDKYPVKTNIYYLQGSHDGATIAKGAWKHWANVPQGKVYFLLSLKGGHNPGLTKLYDDDKKIKESHEELYSRAIKGESINQEFVDWLNSVFQKNEKNEILKEVNWKLYLTRPSEFEFTDNLKGIKKISNFYY